MELCVAHLNTRLVGRLLNQKLMSRQGWDLGCGENGFTTQGF